MITNSVGLREILERTKMESLCLLTDDQAIRGVQEFEGRTKSVRPKGDNDERRHKIKFKSRHSL